jgi:L-lactate utilization protein LutC
MRDEILGRIRSALKENGRTTNHHEVQGAAVSSRAVAKAAPGADSAGSEALISRFEAELRSVGGNFFRAPSKQAALQHILDLAASIPAKSAVGWGCEVIGELGLVAAFEKSGIAFTVDSGGDDFRQKAINAGLGVSGVDYALADTGSLVVLSGPGHARSASLVPPIHVALVKAEEVLGDLNDLFPLLKARGALSSAIAFITGPSRTADIEMTLVVGVHGPQQLHVVLLDGNTE